MWPRQGGGEAAGRAARSRIRAGRSMGPPMGLSASAIRVVCWFGRGGGQGGARYPPVRREARGPAGPDVQPLGPGGVVAPGTEWVCSADVVVVRPRWAWPDQCPIRSPTWSAMWERRPSAEMSSPAMDTLGSRVWKANQPGMSEARGSKSKGDSGTALNARGSSRIRPTWVPRPFPLCDRRIHPSTAVRGACRGRL